MKATYEFIHEINEDGVITHRLLETAGSLLEIIEASFKYSDDDRKIAFILRWSDESTVPWTIPYASFIAGDSTFQEHLDALRRMYPRTDITDENRAEIHYGIREAI